MIFSERYKISKEVEEWFDMMDKKLKGSNENIRMGRDILGVVQALDNLGYLKERDEKENSNNN